MSKTYSNIKIPYPTEGVVRSAQLSDTVAPENSAQLGLNVNFDRIGSWQTRLGVSEFATQLAGAILTFGSISIQSSGLRRLLAQVGNTISSWDGTAWTSVRTLTSTTNKARYSQFLNLTYTVNGNAGAGGDPIQTFNGTAYSATNVGSLPAGDLVQAGFEGRVWVGDASLDRLYYTDIASPTGVIAGGTNYIEKLSPQDGQSMTALFRVPRALLVFKQNYIIRVYGASSVDPYPAYNVGTYSQESVVQAKDGVYFHHSSGFYKFAYDSQPVEISLRIKDFVNAIPRAYWPKVCGIYDGRDHVEWSIGPVAVEGVTYNNCIVRYSISTQVWTIYDLAGSNLATAMINYDSGTLVAPLIGTVQGKVGRLEDGFTDFGTPFFYDFITRWMSFTDIWAKVKSVSGMMLHSEDGAGAQLKYQTDKDGVNVWGDIGKVEGQYASLFPNVGTNDFNRCRFRINGVTRGAQIIFNGIEVLTLQDKGFNEN